MKTKAKKRKEARIGQYIALLLGLKRKRNGRVDTMWGDKTDIGLYNSVKRVIDEEITIDV